MLKTTICPVCHKPYDETLAECPFCARYNSPLNDAAKETVDTAAPEVKSVVTSPVQEPMKKRGINLLVVLLALLVVLFGAVKLIGIGSHAGGDTSLTEVEEDADRTDTDNRKDNNKKPQATQPEDTAPTQPEDTPTDTESADTEQDTPTDTEPAPVEDTQAPTTDEPAQTEPAPAPEDNTEPAPEGDDTQTAE